jgi:hypothetical protein
MRLPAHFPVRGLAVRAKVVERRADRVWEVGGVSDGVEYAPLCTPVCWLWGRSLMLLFGIVALQAHSCWVRRGPTSGRTSKGGRKLTCGVTDSQMAF